MTGARRFRPVLLLAVLAIAAVLVAAVPAAAAPASAAPQAATVDVSIGPPQVSTRLGESFELRSVITNTGSTPLPGRIVHLNVVSLTSNVYVDPEDWSASRTNFLPPLGAGASTTASWPVKAVNGGDFAIYVVVVPGPDQIASSSAEVSASPAVDVHVSEQRSINPGGVLPLVLAVPGVLGVVALGLGIRRRR